MFWCLSGLGDLLKKYSLMSTLYSVIILALIVYLVYIICVTKLEQVYYYTQVLQDIKNDMVNMI